MHFQAKKHFEKQTLPEFQARSKISYTLNQSFFEASESNVQAKNLSSKMPSNKKTESFNQYETRAN
jgi:hypothetical protein